MHKQIFKNLYNILYVWHCIVVNGMLVRGFFFFLCEFNMAWFIVHKIIVGGLISRYAMAINGSLELIFIKLFIIHASLLVVSNKFKRFCIGIIN